MAVVDITVVEALVVAELNAAASYTATVSDPRFYTNQVRDAALSADGMICQTICLNPTHGRRRDFIVSAAVAHGAQVPSHIGPLEAVVIASKAATLWDKAEIENERTNPIGLTLIDPHYFIDGSGVLYHNATTALFNTINATVYYADYTRDASTFLCKSPSEYTAAVTAGTLAALFPVEGENTGVAAYYDQQWRVYLNQIAIGEAAIPSFRSIQNIQQETA